MAGSEEFRDVVYEAAYYSAQKVGLSSVCADDLARMVEHAIRARLGGDRWYVPSLGNADRDRQIVEDLENGLSVSEIARRHSVARSTVYCVRNRWVSGSAPKNRTPGAA